ncbi:MAG: CHAT domain-containing protein [Chloroflexota bacterium]
MSITASYFLRQAVDELEHNIAESSPENRITLLNEAVRLKGKSEQLRETTLLIRSVLAWSQLLETLDNDGSAIEVVEDMRRDAELAAAIDLQIKLLSRLAHLYGRQQAWGKLEDVCRAGIGLVEQVRYRATAVYLQSSFLRAKIGLYRWGVRACYELGDYKQMLAWAELSKSRGTQHRPTTTSNNEAIRQQFSQLSQAIDAARAAGETADTIAELEEERRLTWDLLNMQQQSHSADFRLDKVQAMLAADEAVIYYYWLDADLLIVTLERSDIEVQLRSVTAKQRTQLQRFVDNILKMTGPQGRRKLAQIGKLFSTWLWPRVDWLTDKKRLILSPHQQLHGLPLHVLEQNGRYLIQQYAISYVPNLTLLLQRRKPRRRKRVLALGIGEFALDVPMTPLKSAEAHTERVARLYETAVIDTDLLLGKDVNETTLNGWAESQQLHDYSCLHLTTHGLNVADDTPMESFLCLQNSRLDGLEIANWRLDCDLVVLSACCSGQRPFRGRGMDTIPGDELFGLQAAFRSTGAKQMVSALWPVDGNVAPAIMEQFHRHLIESYAPEVALQKAIIHFLGTETDIGKQNVYYWAPFFLMKFCR